MINQTYQDTQYIYRMSRTNDRTGIRIAVIGQKGPLFVFEDEKDNLVSATTTKYKNKCTG
jgi:hypothetical protein